MGAFWEEEEEEEEAKNIRRARSFSTGQLLLQAVELAGRGEMRGPCHVHSTWQRQCSCFRWLLSVVQTGAQAEEAIGKKVNMVAITVQSKVLLFLM